MAKAEVKTTEKAVEVPQYPKEKLLTSKQYKNRQDALSFLLEDGKSYTFEQVDKILADFMKGKVN